MAHYTGGCLCGALRWEANGEPTYSGLCYCADCRKASGSGCIPFMGFERAVVSFNGPILRHVVKSRLGTDAVRNHCAVCGGLVFGGEVGESDSFTLYAGSLDEPLRFHPTIAIFTRNRPTWAVIPPGLKTFEELPPRPR